MDTKLGQAVWSFLMFNPPGGEPERAGVVLLDLSDNSLYLRLKTKLETRDQAILQVWSGMHDDILERAAAYGGGQTFDWLEMDFSHAFRLGGRQQIQFEQPLDPEDVLVRLFTTGVLGKTA